MENFNELLEKYVAELQEKHHADALVNLPGLCTPERAYETFVIQTGKRWVKIIRRLTGEKMGSVHCFIDPATGHIYKPASFQTPAKGIRGNVANPNRPIFAGQFYAR